MQCVHAEEEKMKKYFLVAMAAALAVSGCSNVVMKNFKVFTYPSDADIRVVSGVELKEVKFRAPATITAGLPKDPVLAAKATVAVSKENYQQKTIALSDIKDGDILNIKLEKILRDIVRYKLSYRLVSPVVSQELQFRNGNVAVSFTVGEQSLQMRFENLSAYDLKILWERAEFTDENKQTHRLMHSGVRYPDRNNPIPDQLVLSRSSVQEAVTPIDHVHLSQQKKGYEVSPLFSLEGGGAAALKGKSIILFIPVEINRQILHYNFTIEITDAVKEIIKG
jgi:hypothetical protein